MQRLRQTLTPWLALYLVALLLAAQALGVAHGVAHGTGALVAGDGRGRGDAAVYPHSHSHFHSDSRPAVHSLAHPHPHSHPHFHTPADPVCDDGHAQAPASPAPPAPPAQAAQAADGAHGHSEAGAECPLYDQLLGHADALPAALSAVAFGGTAAPLCAEGVFAPGRHAAAAYQARAPPVA